MYSLLLTLVLVNGHNSTLVLDTNLEQEKCLNSASLIHIALKDVQSDDIKDYMVICRQEND